MKKIKCLLGLHQWQTVDLATGFHTIYTDVSNLPIYHLVYYQMCKCCAKRRLKDTVKKDVFFGSRHNGIEAARVAWVEYGKIPNSGLTRRTDPPTPKKPKLEIVK